MKKILIVILLFAGISVAADRVRSAMTIDDVAGLPVLWYSAHRSGESTTFNVHACFIARDKTTNAFVPLHDPCASCVSTGLPTNADLQPCRQKVLANPANGFNP